MNPKKKTSPRLSRAIREAFRYASSSLGWLFIPIEDIWYWIFCLAYKADKYDVMNRLFFGHKRMERSFIRADFGGKHFSRVHLIEFLIIIILITI